MSFDTSKMNDEGRGLLWPFEESMMTNLEAIGLVASLIAVFEARYVKWAYTDSDGEHYDPSQDKVVTLEPGTKTSSTPDSST